MKTKGAITVSSNYLIRKHKNRKLYDMNKHMNITLKEVLEIFRTGADLRVIDSDGNDVTEDTVIQSFALLQTPKMKRKLLDYARQGF